MKKVYISHPLFTAGKLDENIIRINRICATILKEPTFTDIIPLAPYLQWLTGFDDNNPNHREKALFFSELVIDVCDELWVFGISDGVQREIKYAQKINIPVIYMEDIYENYYR